PAEQVGTYTSSERRVQMMQKAIDAPGEARPLWKVCAELLARTSDSAQAYYQSTDVLDKIRTEISDFADVSMDDLAGEGALLDRRRPAVEGGV
ncbi:molybdopterin-dependent oxidoreductase, partial [Klebsiella pneumoniae]